MKTQQFSIGRFISAAFLTVMFLGMTFVIGCKKSENNPVASADQSVSTTTADVANEVSDAIAANNGGVMDQVNDVFELAGGVGIAADMGLAKTTSDSTYTQKSYDTTTHSWSLFVYKQRSVLPGYYGVWTRTYWHQFLANGQPQQFRVTGGVAADVIKHKLLAGTGYYWTPRLVHHLTAIGSDWTVSNTNTDTVTINGSYSRAGVDTLKTVLHAGRVLTHSITLTLVNVKGPRGLRYNRSDKTSGTIQGTYTATVMDPGKQPFTTTKTFTITLGGGNGKFTIDGTTYNSDLATGDH